MHVWSSQLDHELLEDGNNIPQVSVASRLSTGPSTGPDTGVQANSASMAAIEVHCLSYPSGEPAAGAQFTVSLWVWPLWIYRTLPPRPLVPPGCSWSRAGHDGGTRASPLVPHAVFSHQPSRDVHGAALWPDAIPTQPFLLSLLSQGSGLSHALTFCSLSFKSISPINILHVHHCFSTRFLDHPNC